MLSMDGMVAPPFELEGSDGTKHALKEFSGKTVIIYFYPRDNTPGCTKEACGFRDIHRQLLDLDVILLGISRDSLGSHDKFIRSFSLPFLLLSDPDGKVMERYGAYGEKVMYGRKTTGTIRSTVVIGPDGKIVRHWPKVKKAEDHPQEVLEFLRGNNRS